MREIFKDRSEKEIRLLGDALDLNERQRQVFYDIYLKQRMSKTRASEFGMSPRAMDNMRAEVKQIAKQGSIRLLFKYLNMR